jgi:hypothetical protein
MRRRESPLAKYVILSIGGVSALFL